MDKKLLFGNLLMALGEAGIFFTGVSSFANGHNIFGSISIAVFLLMVYFRTDMEHENIRSSKQRRKV